MDLRISHCLPRLLVIGCLFPPYANGKRKEASTLTEIDMVTNGITELELMATEHRTPVCNDKDVTKTRGNQKVSIAESISANDKDNSNICVNRGDYSTVGCYRIVPLADTADLEVSPAVGGKHAKENLNIINGFL